MTIWEELSAIAALGGLVVSIFALVISIQGANSSNLIAKEALETSRQANSIALGLVREPAVIEFSDSGLKNFTFDFTKSDSLRESLIHYVSINNKGKKAVDAIAIEIIGVVGLTYRLTPPAGDIRPLPAVNTRLELKSALQPAGAMLLDVRKIALLYLHELGRNLPQDTAEYNTVVNVVLAPKSINEPIPAGAGSKKTTDDRRLLSIKFNTAVLKSAEAAAALEMETIPHRIFDR